MEVQTEFLSILNDTKSGSSSFYSPLSGLRGKAAQGPSSGCLRTGVGSEGAADGIC